MGVKNKMAASTLRVKNSCAKPATQDTDKSRHRRHRPTGEGASRRPYAEAHAQVVPTALPAFQDSLLLAFDPTASGKRPEFTAVMESRKKTESGRKAAESWTGPRTLSPQHIIAFFGDTNYINHAQIRYVCEINHSPSGATRPRVSRFISVYVPIGHDLSKPDRIKGIPTCNHLMDR